MPNRHRHLRLVADPMPPTTLRLAFASTDRMTVDQHFGASTAFAIYAVDGHSAQLIEVIEFIDTVQDEYHDKLPTKIAALVDCTAVYCLAAGSSAIQRLLAAGVQPIRVEPGAPIEQLLTEFQQELNNGPSGWLARVIKARMPADSHRFDAMAAEGWHESN